MSRARPDRRSAPPDRPPDGGRRAFLATLGGALAGPALLGLAGCRRGGRVVEEGPARQVLHVGNGLEPVSLDPHLTTGVSENNLHFALYEGLLRLGPGGDGVRPGVAREWETAEDGRIFRFRLRPEARWSDGAPVTAEDFLFAWRRLLTPTLGGRQAGLLALVRGAEDFHAGRLDDFAQTGFRTLSDGRLEVELREPAPYFPQLVCHPAWFPLPAHAVRAAGRPEDRLNPWTRPGRHVGNGPFRLVAHEVNQVVAVERNPHYHGAAAVRLRGIRFHPIEDRHTEELAFRAGQLHLTYTVPHGHAAVYRRRGAAELRIEPAFATEYYVVNCRRPPLDDPRVRRALSLALDRAALVERVLNGVERPARHFVPPGLPGTLPVPAPGEDLAEARALLAAAGHGPGRPGRPLDLLFNTSENNRRLAEALQEVWRTRLGVAVTLRNQEFASYDQSRRLGDFDLLRANWVGDYPDPATFLDLCRTGSDHNYGGWSSGPFDAALEGARRASGAARAARLAEAEAVLLGEAPLLPLYHRAYVYLLHGSVRGWRGNLLGWPDWGALSLA